jgi:hypothetical protein
MCISQINQTTEKSDYSDLLLTVDDFGTSGTHKNAECTKHNAEWAARGSAVETG